MASRIKTSFLGDRRLISVGGADAKDFLQRLITQDIERLAPGGAAFGALLTPQGKIIADFLIGTDGQTFFLDCQEAVAEALVKKLTLYKLRSAVEITDVTDHIAIAIAWLDTDTPPAPQGWVTDPRLPGLGVRSYAPKDQLAEQMGDWAEADPQDWSRHAARLGVPLQGRDYALEDAFPMDVNMDALNGVDYAKGCFTGQEVVSRMKRKGEVRKRSWALTLTGAAAPGDSVMAGETTIGTLTSVTGDTAIAVMRLDRLAKTDATPTVNDAPATLIEPDYLKATP